MSQIIVESERVELLLQSLPDSYNQLIINLTNGILSNFLVFEDVASAVLEKEDRRKNKEDKLASSQQAEALTMTRGRSMEHGSSGSQNHGRSKLRSKKNVKCYNYGKRGHFKNEYRLLKKNGDFKGKDPELTNAQECVAENLSDGEVLCNEATTIAESRKKFADI